MELSKTIVAWLMATACTQSGEASVDTTADQASITTPPHILYLIHTNRLDQALEHYQSYVNRHGRHDTEFLQQLGLSVLEQGAKCRDAEAQLMTLFGAGISMNERALDILMRGVSATDPRLQYLALNFLARLQNDLADSCLMEAFRSGNLLIRLEAVRQIALKKLPHATHLVESLMGKMEGDVVALFPQLFASIGDDDAIKILRRLLAHPNAAVRVEAVISAAKAGRDDLLPKIKILSSQPCFALQEACAMAFGQLGDETALPYLEKMRLSKVPHVKLAALLALYTLDCKGVIAEIRELAAKGDLFAIAALGSMPGNEELLYQLTQSSNPQIRLNAIVGLLELRDPRCLPFLKGILIRDSRDLAFTKMSSQGKVLSYWKVVPSARQNYEDFSIDLELSQHFREALLTETADMPEELFYPTVTSIFESTQTDLVPLAIQLLEQLHTPASMAILRKYQQRPGTPLVRNYCTLALYRLGEEGPYADVLRQWVEQQANIQLIQLRPIVPWELEGDLTVHQITPHETSRLLVEIFEAFAQSQDDKGIDLLLNSVSHGNSNNKYALAGLLMRASL